MATKKTAWVKRVPPDPDNMNERRGEWAGAALQEYQRQTGADIEDAVSDLMADLMHWCDQNNQEFDTELQRAHSHYTRETDA